MKAFQELIEVAAKYGIKISQTADAFQKSLVFKQMQTAFSDEQRKIFFEKIALDNWLRFQAELDMVAPVKVTHKAQEPLPEKQKTLNTESQFTLDDILNSLKAWFAKVASLVEKHKPLMQETEELCREIDLDIENTESIFQENSEIVLNQENIERVQQAMQANLEQREILNRSIERVSSYQKELTTYYADFYQTVVTEGFKNVEKIQQHVEKNRQDEKRLTPEMEKIGEIFELFDVNFNQIQTQMIYLNKKQNLAQQALDKFAQQFSIYENFVKVNDVSSRAFPKPTPFSTSPFVYGLAKKQTSEDKQTDFYNQFIKKQPMSPLNMMPGVKFK